MIIKSTPSSQKKIFNPHVARTTNISFWAFTGSEIAPTASSISKKLVLEPNLVRYYWRFFFLLNSSLDSCNCWTAIYISVPTTDRWLIVIPDDPNPVSKVGRTQPNSRATSNAVSPTPTWLPSSSSSHPPSCEIPSSFLSSSSRSRFFFQFKS